jgi:hypothetical protein
MSFELGEMTCLQEDSIIVFLMFHGGIGACVDQCFKTRTWPWNQSRVRSTQLQLGSKSDWFEFYALIY